MNKKQRSMMLILIIALVIGLGSITYAYWTANTENKISTNTTIQTGVLKLVLDDGTNKDGVLSGTIDPNNTRFTTYLSITNEGTYDTFARLYFKGLTNTFSSDLVYSIEEVDSLPNSGSEPKIVKRIKYQVPVPRASEPARELLADGLLIKMGTLNGNNLTPHTQYYRVTVEYLYSDTVDQSSDMGKTFYTGFDIEQGDKVTENIVMIDNIEQLVELSNEVNAGDSKVGKEYRLMRNLDFNDDDSYLDATQTTYGDINKNGTIEPIKTELTTAAGWTPIGAETNPFSGDFNGQNYELSHLYINNSDASLIELGLFGVVENGTIRNLGIRDENLSSSVSANIGGIVSLFNNSTMDNCYNTITTKNDNVFNINLNKNQNSVSGLIGYITGGNSIITNSHNEINIKGGDATGGIVGTASGDAIQVTISNCYNNGNINNEYLAGGIIGNSSAIVNINNCTNNGSLTTNQTDITQIVRHGGILGKNSGNVKIDNCINSGNITNNKLSYNSAYGVVQGGILSSNYSISEITNSSNTGILTNGNQSGGIVGCIVGNNANQKIINSRNDGSITTYITNINAISLGGLIGINIQSQIIISNSYNTSNIQANSKAIYNNYLGGLVGYSTQSNNVYLINSSNSGNIKDIKGNYPDLNSGLIGLSENGVSYIVNSYNSGNVNGDNTSSGIVNYNKWSSNTGNIYNVYNSGNITSNTTKGGIYANFNNTTSTVNYSNIYYKSGLTGDGTVVNDINNLSFVTTLNNNLSSITLPSELSGYTLSSWCTSDNGPVLDYQVPESERAIRCPAYNN